MDGSTNEGRGEGGEKGEREWPAIYRASGHIALVGAFDDRICLRLEVCGDATPHATPTHLLPQRLRPRRDPRQAPCTR